MSYCFEDIDLDCETAYEINRTDCRSFKVSTGLTGFGQLYQILISPSGYQSIVDLQIDSTGIVTFIPDIFDQGIINRYGGIYTLVFSETQTDVTPLQFTISGVNYTSLILDFSSISTFECGCIDTDAQNFIDFYSITDPIQQTAINYYVEDLKGNGITTNNSNIWSKSTAIYPIVGGDADKHKGNLVNPGMFDLGFVNSPAHSADGVDFNGIDEYATTGIIPSTHLLDNNITYGLYLADNIAFNGCGIGALNSFTQRSSLFPRFGGDIILWDCYNVTVGEGRLVEPNTNADGLITASRTSLTSSKVYREGVSFGAITTGGGAIPTVEIYVMAENDNNTPVFRYQNQIRLVCFLEGLLDNEMLDFSEATTTYQTTLGRAI